MNNPLENFPYETEFMDMQGKLVGFLYRLTCNRQDAEDLAQDTYIAVRQNIAGFKERSSFKTWVFSIAINKARNHHRVQKRWAVDYQDRGESAHMSSETLMERLMDVHNSRPDARFEMQEHVDFCFQCMVKTLDLPQQICLWLRYFYDFSVIEIQDATGFTEGMVKHALTYGKKTLTEVFENRCAFINQSGVCYQCSSLNGLFNPKQEEEAKRNAEKIRRQISSNPQLVELRMQFIKDINPLDGSCSHVHNYLMENTPNWAETHKE